jgi:DNA-binding LacI/PurR family transcriptional regulator
MTDTPSKKSKLGLREIASAAQVSIATVSRVLNGSNRVDPAIRKSVLAAAADLDIDLSQRNRTKALAFLLSNRAMQHVFHSSILLGAEAYCAARHWELIFQSSNYPPQIAGKELHLPNVVQRHDIVRGVILAGTNSLNLLELLADKGVPFVVLGNNVMGEIERPTYDAVFSDDIQGGRDMTRYLISLGHRHIWFVGNIRLPWFARCFEGYQRAMEEAGLTPRHSTVDSEDETDIGYLGTKSLLAKGEPVSAIFAGNDPTAHGVYKGLRDSGLDIPGDISVVGCDDTIGSWLYPALTTIREFPEQLGRQMVELLLNRIANPNQEPQRVTMPTELIKRDSCRAISPSEDVSTGASLQGILS